MMDCCAKYSRLTLPLFLAWIWHCNGEVCQYLLTAEGTSQIVLMSSIQPGLTWSPFNDEKFIQRCWCILISNPQPPLRKQLWIWISRPSEAKRLKSTNSSSPSFGRGSVWASLLRFIWLSRYPGGYATTPPNTKMKWWTKVVLCTAAAVTFWMWTQLWCWRHQIFWGAPQAEWRFKVTLMLLWQKTPLVFMGKHDFFLFRAILNNFQFLGRAQ